MSDRSHTSSQRDFSAGEVDPSLKRSEDNPFFKTSCRQCSNFLITDTKKLRNRFGRTAIFDENQRVDEVLMSPGNVFFLVFGQDKLVVRNASGGFVFGTIFKGDGFTPLPWTNASVKNIVWDVYQLSVFICYADDAPNNVPLVLTWDGVSQSSTWTLKNYTEFVTPGGQKRTFYYRISPQNITMLPSATAGTGTITFSSPIAVPAMVGTRFRYIGRTVLVTGFVSSTVLNVTIEETLLSTQAITFGGPANATYTVGDIVIGSVSGAEGIVVNSGGGGGTMTVQLIKPLLFLVATASIQEYIVGPGGSFQATAVSGPLSPPAAVSIWDDEVMNPFRGYPSSVTVDQGRLVFMNFPSVPSAIGYSAVGNLTDLYVPYTDVVADNAIFEIAPGKSQILYMVPGQESSEFIFCDNAIYYVPITASQPLSAAAGIAFNKMTSDGCAAVQPRLVQEALVYVSAGGSTMRVITATGAFQRPYEVRPLSFLHDHLFKSPIAIAAPTGTDPNFPERYIYVLNSDGTLAVGKLSIQDGRLQEPPGWVSMSGVGTVVWVSARAGDVIFTTTYQVGTAAPATIVEKNDSTQYLDAAIFYASAPGGPGGTGPLWFIANGTCTVMDRGTRQLGLYNVDANGFLIPQFIDGENLTSPQLIVGQAWTATLEPWLAGAEPGTDLEQRMTERGINKVILAFENSTGFVWQKLFSAKQTRTSPPLGSVVKTRRVTTYNQDDDPTQPPPLREDFDLWRPGGREFDPRIAIVKDTAGPLTILEFGSEATV